jgi:hypothetical protein
VLCPGPQPAPYLLNECVEARQRDAEDTDRSAETLQEDGKYLSFVR